MLDSVTAVRFDRRMKKGRTCPCLLTCTKENGEEVEVITKFSARCEIGVKGLAAESIAAMLAHDTGLPIPEPFAVHLDDEFIECVRSEDDGTANLMHRSSRIAFGSLKLPSGFTTVPIGLDLSAVLDTAAEIFAFDALTQNPDRKIDNPNCLYDGTNLAIIDHELCFMIDGIIGWQPPWHNDSLRFLKNQHVFYPALTRKTHDYTRLLSSWCNISEQRLQEYCNALPNAWTSNRDQINHIFNYLRELNSNIDAAFSEVTRVLS